jgi:hypothetical protein
VQKKLQMTLQSIKDLYAALVTVKWLVVIISKIKLPGMIPFSYLYIIKQKLKVMKKIQAGSFVIFKINNQLFRGTVSKITATELYIPVAGGTPLQISSENILQGEAVDNYRLTNNQCLVLNRLKSGSLSISNQQFLNALPRYQK